MLAALVASVLYGTSQSAPETRWSRGSTNSFFPDRLNNVPSTTAVMGTPAGSRRATR